MDISTASNMEDDRYLCDAGIEDCRTCFANGRCERQAEHGKNLVTIQEILSFIDNFKDAQSAFLYGCCYWFAFILNERFGGTTMYLPVENHFVQAIGKRLYDVSGDVTAEYLTAKIIPWVAMEQYDSTMYQRLIQGYINKERFDDDSINSG